MGWFHFKGKDSRDFGILISAAPEKVRAERRVEQVTIRQKRGADNGRRDVCAVCAFGGVQHQRK